MTVTADLAPPKLTRKQLTVLLRAEFPDLFGGEGAYDIEKVWHGGSIVRRHFDRSSLRPGGTLSGATMMALADFAVYVAIIAALIFVWGTVSARLAILASIGWVPLAVTTNLTINFLKKPAQRPLLATVRLIKLGKRLAVGEVEIRSEGDDELVAHATSTYSIPPQPDAR